MTLRLDPLIVAQLGNLQLRARRILDGLYSGHHVNLNRGTSQEFSEHRPYNPGDDLKGLDWKIFGRTDRLVIKQYEEETNVIGMIVMDDSASMKFSWDNRISKWEYAKTMAAAMGYLLVAQHDAVGLVSRSKKIQSGSSRGHLDLFFNSLDSIQPEGVWGMRSLLDEMGTSLKKRGFLVVFSDLMQDPDEMISTLRTFQARKNEVMVFQILDPAEIDLPYTGSILFEDAETHELLKTEPEVIRSAYKKLVQEKLESFSHVFRRAKIEYHLLTTQTPFDKGLGAYLSWRGFHL